MDDIKNYDTFTKIEPINKGWSSDKKYYVETVDGENCLLRIADVLEYEQKLSEFNIMKRISKTGVNMSQQIDFGLCNDGKKVYQLLTWCEGEEAKEVLPSLTIDDQYKFGVKAGKVLRKINTAETYKQSSDWKKLYGKKIDNFIKQYRNCGMRFENDELFISYLEANYHLMDNRPTCLTHEDFQSDNLVISPDNELYVIDFQQCGIVDPYYALMSAMVSADESLDFARGQIHEYFEGNPPEDFWDLFLFYFIAETINVFPIAITMGQEEIDDFRKTARKTLEVFDNFNNPVPKWYF